jgi:hypothetical protein
MKEIIEINNRLRADAKTELPPEGITLYRDRGTEELGQISPALRVEVLAMKAELERLVPNDFGYTLSLGEAEPSFSLEYENGPMTSAFRGHDWKIDESMFDQLQHLDWESERAWAISGTEIFDQLAEAAKHLPENIPSTEALRRAFREGVKAFVKDKRRDTSQVYVLAWSEDEGLQPQAYKQFEDFSRQLPDLMTCQYQVVSVVRDGKPLSDLETDELKRRALKELEDMPISHAQASGRLFGPGILGGK